MHRAPVHLAGGGDARLAGDAADVEAQRVAHLQAQRLHQALLHAHAAGLAARPGALLDLVVRRLVGRVAEVELPVHQALGAVVGVVVGRDGPAVDGDQPAAEHRIPVVAAHAGAVQRRAEGLLLVGHHVDDEAVGRIRRRGAPPARHQVGAQQHQQHQRQQAHRQAADLHHRIGRPRRDLPRRQHQPARRRGLVDQPAQQLHRHPRQQGEEQHRAGEAAHRDAAELHVAAGRQQQGREAQRAHAQHRRRGRPQAADVAPDHAQGRHPGQLQHRRQAEGEEQRQPDADAEGGRPQRGRGQRRLDQPGQQQHEEVVHAPAHEHAEQAGRQADQRELHDVSGGDGALALAQHAQHGAVVQVAGREAARRQRHRHGRKQRRQQRDEVEELARAVQRLAHLGAAAFEGLQPRAAQLALLDDGVQLVGERLHRPGAAGDGEAVGDAAGRLHEAGARHVGLVDHDARREAHEAGAAVGLDHDHARDRQARIAQQQRVAHLEIERGEQPGVDPHLTGRGHLARGLTRAVGRGRHLQAAAQRVARRHRLEGHQPAGAALRVGCTRHGREGVGHRAVQPQRRGALREGRRRRVVRHQHRVAAEQLARVALQAALEPVGEEAHGRERGHGQQHGDDQQAQFAGAQVAAKGAPAQADGGVHGERR